VTRAKRAGGVVQAVEHLPSKVQTPGLPKKILHGSFYTWFHYLANFPSKLKM
jgi:hypothetical protein